MRREAQLLKLTRNYDIYRGQYEELVERRESARLSRESGTRDESRYRIRELPHTSANPTPNRLLLNTSVFIVAWIVVFLFVALLAKLTQFTRGSK